MRQLSFARLLGENTSRMEIIVTFLAVLELVKQREIVARQDATFGEIVLIVADDRDESAVVENSNVGDTAQDQLAATAQPQKRTTKESGSRETK
jgi:segregation and condensation protein A